MLSDGWQYDTDANEYWKEVDGEEQVSKDVPEGCGPLGVIAVANAIKDMGALSSFTFGDNQAVTMTTAMIEANFSGKLLSYEAHIVCAFLPKCT